ncbi:PTS mannose transporter subunit IIC [Carnobacterium divergens]|uniref:PTS transporter subunit EIIC n=1 Tax=Carnobacterium divergens TaxID=2748 RepID=UPI0010720474|nr:PTS transporter subunit EIIC [Carnobacterium divergens]TFJ46629.1 PTS mannose transporter subunit IIC [Carnobacterium divergens]TFJ53592.1 PTS mannose transporter subunit IIC [Carnobacterium divergens]
MLNQMQKIGKALMLPIAVLPAAGLLNRLGAADVLNVPFMNAGGNSIFTYLSLMFAMGIAIGLSKDNSGIAALGGALIYFVLNFGVIGVNENINMGVFAGFIAGLMSPLIYNRVYDKYEGSPYFNGRHIALLLNVIAALLLVAIFGLIWPTVQNGLDHINSFIVGAGALGAGVFEFANRMLIPTGLHHVLNSYLWFAYGSFPDAATGVMANGDINRFFAGDPTAGAFQVGFFPIMMFGLPAAAMAMVAAAKPNKRKATFGMMLSVAVTAFLTGITEPLEFSFMFVAFPLYVVHAVLAGIAGFVTNLLGIKMGFTFSAGAIDYALNFGLGTKAWMLIPIGFVFAVVYFVIFYFSILKFDIKTPGREDDEDEADLAAEVPNAGVQTAVAGLGASENDVAPTGDKYDIMAAKYITALGGPDNFTSIDNCTTRLRLQMKDTSIVNEQALKKAGARGVLKINETAVQVIVGTDVEFIADKLKNELDK